MNITIKYKMMQQFYRIITDTRSGREFPYFKEKTINNDRIEPEKQKKAAYYYLIYKPIQRYWKIIWFPRRFHDIPLQIPAPRWFGIEETRSVRL